MSTQNVAPEQLVRLYRLIHELCEIGSDTRRWRERLLIELEGMLDATLSASYVIQFSLDPSQMGPKTVLYLERGTNDIWKKYVEAGDLTRDPVTPYIMARFGTDFTVTRGDCVDDATWYASDFCRDVSRPSDIDDQLFSQVAVNDPKLVDGLGFARPFGKPRFTAGDVELVRFLHQELARLWNRPDPIGIHTLPPRQREVLDGMRRGESRKIIAENMAVTEHTVHGYEKALFQRAGVGSRGELVSVLSECIRPNLLP